MCPNCKLLGLIDTEIAQCHQNSIIWTLKKIKLYQGVLNGLDSMYRRSVATGYKKDTNNRKVDSLVGFSNLKVVYKYEAAIPTGVPPVAGTLTLTANELTAHLALSIVSDPENVDLDIEFLEQLKPESLTVEGAANIMIANFKNLLEHQLVATMSNTLIYGVEMLKTLPSCNPFVPGQIKDKEEEPLIETKPAPVEYENSDPKDSESEEMLWGKTDPQRRSTKYPKSQLNRSVMKKKQKELKKYKGKSKKVITENKT